MQNTPPMFKDGIYLTDGGLETTLIFQQHVPLNHFAAYELLRTEAGRNALENYTTPYLHLAKKFKTGFVLESPTWRANPDWGYRAGYTADELFALNRQAIRFMRELAQPFTSSIPHIIISGNIGPRGDGYEPGRRMTADEARAYHSGQLKAFALADADLASAFTLNYVEEAIGIVNAARDFHLPVVISFTVETDGRLPGGQTLQQAIEATDAATSGYADYFMINCAHPQHFKSTLTGNELHWIDRIRGIRANASQMSHKELDESETLDSGNKCLLARNYLELSRLLPRLKVIGGCCGTDHTHIDVIFRALIDMHSKNVTGGDHKSNT